QVSGLEAAERIAAIDPGVRVILFTNNAELCMRDPRSDFASACIEKASDFAELERAVRSVLASRRGNTWFRIGLPPIHTHTAAGPRCESPGTR
ncbi:MAG: hypothetical protein MUF48_19925, partial [Pirellulaceae bacterium]|nr:hypothetical protein [Pirellulaceae bacterium]